MSKKIMSQLNVVPFVDIIFVLLVIFIISSSTVYIDHNIDIPSQNKNESINEKNEVEILYIDKEMNFNYMGEIIEINELNNYFSKNDLIRLGFDGEIKFEEVSNKINHLSRKGFERISIVFIKSDNNE